MISSGENVGQRFITIHGGRYVGNIHVATIPWSMHNQKFMPLNSQLLRKSSRLVVPHDRYDG